jgi:hypothetical protein
MAQIIIDIPKGKTRRYALPDAERIKAIIKLLDRGAVRLNQRSENISAQEFEDIQDSLDARDALEEMRRTGTSFNVDELREEFGLK